MPHGLFEFTDVKTSDYLLTASFSSLPALKVGRFEAGILIVSPVRGLRPVVAARLETENVPKPTRRTSSPFFREALMQSITASRAVWAFVLGRSACFATASISSDLFTGYPHSFKVEHPVLTVEGRWKCCSATQLKSNVSEAHSGFPRISFTPV